jgi:hypothetical protein
MKGHDMSLVTRGRKRTKIDDEYARGVPEIAVILGWPERVTRYALEQGHLKAGRLGSIWIANKEKLRQQLATIAAGGK